MSSDSTRHELVIESNDPPKLVPLSFGGDPAFGDHGRFVLGRGASSNLALNDQSISRQHCALISGEDGFKIEDLDSAGGTFVNGNRVEGTIRLRHGDRIKIGNTVLRLSVEPQAALPSRQHSLVQDMTMVHRPGARTPVSELASSVHPIPLKEHIVIGRDPQCDVVVADREVSRHQAEIRREHGGYFVRDLASTNGTFLNGVEVRGRMELREGSHLRVGPSTFVVQDGHLVTFCQKGNVRIVVENLTKEITSRENGQKLLLLDNVSLVIEPNEFVAILGPSGSGKSTLMDAVNGRRPATSGRVLVNEDDFYQARQYYRRAIGYVPQKDIVHTTLTVQQAFTFTARLRLPSDTSELEIERIVSEVIQKVGLSERGDVLIANLSGGQLKRVSLGVELIADPSLLFLDEATSGLDAGTEAKMMTLFRQIADDGKTVLCITHNVENVKLCDLVVVLAQGKLVYYGPPADLPKFFGVTQISEVYDRLESQPAGEWAVRYRCSAHYQLYVSDRSKASTKSEKAPQPPVQPTDVGKSSGEIWRQMRVLTHRYTTVIKQDRRSLALLLVQAPVIGFLLGMVFSKGTTQDHRMVVFLMAISAIWFGCINASREVVKELPIYLRERAVNLELWAYLGSKILVLAGLCAVQCIGLLIIVAPMTQLEPQTGPMLLTLLLTSWCGMLMGLVVSALVDNADKAMAIIPVLLIPQVVLANVITPLDGFMRTVASCLMVSFWSVDGMLNSIPDGTGFLSSTHHTWAEGTFCLCLFLAAFVVAAGWALKRYDKLG